MPEGHSMVQLFSIIPDPRKRGHSQTRHKLVDIIVMAVCAVVGGADNWAEVELFCEQRKDWFEKILGMQTVPSHDTFWRVFSLLDSHQFQRAFYDWVNATYERLPKEVINIDGKSLSGTIKDYPVKADPIHIVNAWASASGLVLGQNKSHTKGHYERDQMVALLDYLHLNGCIVTADAMGTNQAMCNKVLLKGGHYVLAVKKNQRSTYETIVSTMSTKTKQAASYETSEKGHSRIEHREYEIRTPNKALQEKWPGIRSIGKVRLTRSAPDTVRNGQAKLKTTIQTRYYISSLPSRNIRQFAHAVRSHWSIENKLHWCLDVVFNEDKCRSIVKNSAENFAIIRRMAFNIVNQDKTAKLSKRQKRLRAGWDMNYMEQIVLK